MTTPVLMEMEDGYRPFWETVVYPMSFLLPAEHQANPPIPTDDSVSWQDEDESSCIPVSHNDLR